jgi:ATP-binding protein involved in chromosome partitioning
MTNLTEQQIKDAIIGYIDPYLEKNLIAAKVVKKIDIDNNNVNINLDFGYPMSGHESAVNEAITSKVSAVDGVNSVTVNIDNNVISHSVQKGVKVIPGIKNIIAIASGKGGVGKSTCAVNLALALRAEGANVGLLDADIYGPSQPRMLGSTAQPESEDGKTLKPIVSHGIQSMSIGYLIDEETPMIWRGPMVTQALEQLLNDTLWEDLDYLIVDLPPGTGDTQLTLAQKIPVSGAVIITTPQDIALLDARKGLKMFEKVQVPVLGVVENMSIHICSK